MTLPIIILNYNSSGDCRKCIGYLKRQTGVQTEIIVVDNCSPRSGEQEAVRQLCEAEGCTFIQGEENRGYNAGNNIGLRYAAERGYAYALIANPDMEFPQTDYLARMVQAMDEHPEAAVVGSNILNPSGRRESPWEFSPTWREFPFVFLIDKLQRKEICPLGPNNQYCDIVLGCCLLVRMSDIIQIGYFDEGLFLFCEEPTLGRQVKRINKKIYYLHDATAIHQHIESQKGSFINRYKIHAASRRYYLRKHSGFNKFVICMIILSQYLYDIGVLIYLKSKGLK